MKLYTKDSGIVKLYARAILEGRKTIEDVREDLRPFVLEALEELKKINEEMLEDTMIKPVETPATSDQVANIEEEKKEVAENEVIVTAPNLSVDTSNKETTDEVVPQEL